MQLLSTAGGRVKRALWIAVAAVGYATTACGGMARQVTADVDDFEAYRQFRRAPTFPQKLVAGWRYLQGNPHGRWREPVGVWFERADTAYYEQVQRNLMRLRVYLELLPNGPNSDLARQRVKQLEKEEELQRERDRELDEEVVIMEIALEQAAHQRDQLLSAFLGFTKHLLAIDTWGEPTWELSAPFLVDWRIREPRARCRGTRCVKTLSLPYAIPDAYELAPRQAIFDVVLELRHGNVARAMLTGPELFSRVGEAAQLRAILPDDVMGRATAISEAMSLVGPLLDQRFPPERCAREAVSPVVVHRECDGMRIVISAGGAPEEDRIVIEPMPAPRAAP
jgi:hypothetical protein